MEFDDDLPQRAFDEGGIDPRNFDGATRYWAAVSRWYASKLSACEKRLRDEEEAHATLQARCFDYGNPTHSSIFDERDELYAALHNTDGERVSHAQAEQTSADLLKLLEEAAGRERALAARLGALQRYVVDAVQPEYNELCVVLSDLCTKYLLCPCVACGEDTGHEPECPLGRADEFFRSMTKPEPPEAAAVETPLPLPSADDSVGQRIARGESCLQDMHHGSLVESIRAESAAEIARLRRELAAVDAALDEVTKCIAPTRAQRIRDSFEIIRLSTDAAVFDHEKAEHSVRAQCTQWMQDCRLLATERDEAVRRLDRCHKLLNVISTMLIPSGQKRIKTLVREIHDVLRMLGDAAPERQEPTDEREPLPHKGPARV